MKKMIIGSTRAGLTLKTELIGYLERKGFTVEDAGMREGGEFVPYHKVAMAVASAVSDGRCDRGVIICGTGAGSVITAAKFKGVYPVHAVNEFTARKAKAVNNCNVLVFGEWLTPAQHAFPILDAWLETEFGDGSDDDWKVQLRRFYDEIRELENERFKA